MNRIYINHKSPGVDGVYSHDCLCKICYSRLSLREDAIPSDMLTESSERREELIGWSLKTLYFPS